MTEDTRDDLQRSMGRVEAKVDLLLARTAATDKRLSLVEKKVWWASGAGAVIGWIGSRALGA